MDATAAMAERGGEWPSRVLLVGTFVDACESEDEGELRKVE